jgi:uncharacterized protein YbbC (DUF1343 family)
MALSSLIHRHRPQLIALWPEPCQATVVDAIMASHRRGDTICVTTSEGAAMVVSSGLDRWVADQLSALRGQRVALLGHPASVDASCVHLLDRCLENGVSLVRLFGPEHGILGDAQDMAHVGGSRDARSGVEVVSLYGPTRESLFLRPDQLSGVDVLVCDLQDIGARYYTFAYTLAFALRACAAAKVRCVVLDRPNPINGVSIEGNVVKAAFGSFVGEYPLANRHGLTMGELAHWFVAQDKLDVDLDVVWMTGWQRDMYYEDTGLPWVLPSPNMPTVDTAVVYIGGCLWEGTNLSEGRGTTKPFELVGGPMLMDAHGFASRVRQQGVPGAVVRPCCFRPTFQKHAGELIGGAQVHVVDRSSFSSLRAGVAVIHAAHSQGGFDWRRTTYEYVSDRLAIDLLFGDDAQRLMLERGANVDDVMASMEPARLRFADDRTAFLHAGYS